MAVGLPRPSGRGTASREWGEPKGSVREQIPPKGGEPGLTPDIKRSVLLPHAGQDSKRAQSHYRSIRIDDRFSSGCLYWGNAGGRDEQLLETPLKPDDIKRELADLYAVISHLDHQIGRILRGLEDTGQYESTLIIYTTDNGAGVGRHGIRGYQNMYEHALAVPLILRGPGIPRDSRFAAQVYLRDLYPTVCDMMGAPIPATVEGRSLVPVLRGQVTEVHPEVYAYWHREGLKGDAPIERMVRTDRWKLIHYTHLDRHQLFDLQNDPWELRDLSADPRHAPTRAELQGKLQAWFAPRIAQWKRQLASMPEP